MVEGNDVVEVTPGGGVAAGERWGEEFARARGGGDWAAVCRRRPPRLIGRVSSSGNQSSVPRSAAGRRRRGRTSSRTCPRNGRLSLRR